MKPLLDFLRPYLDRWKAMPMGRRVGMITAIALMIALGVWGYAAANRTEYAVLFSSLEASDAAAIVESLKASKTPYKLEENGTQISVPEPSVHELRLSLASQGLPDGGGAGFELFDEQRFGESEFSEQVKYHRALEGELARTITHVNGVESARVHLVLPSRSVFLNNENSASASVALRMKPGAKLSPDQIKGLVHLVAASVRGLSPEAVTLVDGSGRRLSSGQDESEQAGNSLEFQRNYERASERSLQQILDATLGPGRAMVRVAAEVNFAREEMTEERVDPDLVSARSFQITEERDLNTVATAAGVPGAVGTLEGAEQATGPSTAGVLKRSETRNFEISKTVKRTAEPVGRVARLSIAVVVDGTYTGKGDKRVFAARSPAELAVIKSVVATAAGTKDERGDKVTVECVPFAEQPVEVALPEPTGVDAMLRKNWPYAAAGAGLLLVLLVGGAVMLGRKGKKGAAAVPALEAGRRPLEVRLGAERPAGEIGAGAPGAAGPELTPAAAQLKSPHITEDGALPADAQAEAERIRALTAEIASNDPYLAARVVRGWLAEGASDEEAA
ncbi:MAG: flagellar basal-body MS-ring/collar protein FliF [Polyangiales bacterium]